jgi:hypothetical protein
LKCRWASSSVKRRPPAAGALFWVRACAAFAFLGTSDGGYLGGHLSAALGLGSQDCRDGTESPSQCCAIDCGFAFPRGLHAASTAPDPPTVGGFFSTGVQSVRGWVVVRRRRVNSHAFVTPIEENSAYREEEHEGGTDRNDQVHPKIPAISFPSHSSLTNGGGRPPFPSASSTKV